MELIIKQSKLKFNYEYKIYSHDKLIYTVKANRTIIPYLRKVIVYDLNGMEVFSLKQESLAKIFLRIIPFISFFQFSTCPYNYYDNGLYKGFLREKFNGDGYILGEIENIDYEMWQHTATDFSFYCMGRQVGLIKKQNWKEFDQDIYKIIYEKWLDKKIAILFCLLADILWNTSDTGINSLSYTYVKQLTGKELDKDWKPME